MGVAGAGFLVYLIVHTGRVRCGENKKRDEVENKFLLLAGFRPLAWVAVSSTVWARTF